MSALDDLVAAVADRERARLRCETLTSDLEQARSLLQQAAERVDRIYAEVAAALDRSGGAAGVRTRILRAEQQLHRLAAPMIVHPDGVVEGAEEDEEIS